MTGAFPFGAVVGQDDAKLALRLAAVDPLIGGVLLRGEKGSAKTTLARGFAALLGDVPFVEIPLGATEDRVVGSLDTRAALVDSEVRFQPGLLAEADGGVLYVDEINLLADHLVDVLLDVAVSGENVVERDGLSQRHPARFVLVGSMNPEEGELRPQLLDRFGLCVEVRAPRQLDDRVESVRRRLAFDRDEHVTGADQGLQVLDGLGSATVPDDVIEGASRLALEVGAEGLRADLVLARAAAALAGLDGRSVATTADVRRVAPLVLAHRSRRGPFDPPVVHPEELARAIRDALGDEPGLDHDDNDNDDNDGTPSPDGSPDERLDPPTDRDDGPGRGGDQRRPMVLGSVRRPPTPAAGRSTSPRGRVVGDELAGPSSSIAAVPTLRAVAGRRAADPDAELTEHDLRTAVRVAPKHRTIVVAVDLSGSMGATTRAEAATGCVLGLLGEAYVRREAVALVGFRGDGAEVLLAPTASVEVARNRLDQLETGGTTPLAAGLRTALDVAHAAMADDRDALLVLLTDGRATGTPGALDAALEAAHDVRRTGVPTLVLDCETGTTRLGLAAELAAAIGARHIPVSDLEALGLVETVRGAIR
jgi:magnesium chelatase subunit D